MMMMTMRVPRLIVTLRFIVSPLLVRRSRNQGERVAVPRENRGFG